MSPFIRLLSALIATAIWPSTGLALLHPDQGTSVLLANSTLSSISQAIGPQQQAGPIGPESTANQEGEKQDTQSVKQGATQHEANFWIATVMKFLTLLISWPFIALIVLLYLAFAKKAPDRIGELFKPLRSFELFGTKFVLNEKAGSTAQEAFATYQKQATKEYDLLVEASTLIHTA